MMDYKEVVSQRYDRRVEVDFSPVSMLEWAGPQLHMSRAFQVVLRRVNGLGHDLGKARILEVGCGDGRWTRFIAEITTNPQNIKGTDLCIPRIEIARRMNPAIDYQVSDVVKTPIEGKFDIILAWDVFMHFNEAQSQKALKNIYDALSEHGVFIFFDAWAHSHSDAPVDSQSWGFNPSEIIHLADSEGFTKIFRRNLFRIFPGGRHSEQYHKSHSSRAVSFFEMICPGHPGNFFVVFEKQEK